MCQSGWRADRSIPSDSPIITCAARRCMRAKPGANRVMRISCRRLAETGFGRRKSITRSSTAGCESRHPLAARRVCCRTRSDIIAFMFFWAKISITRIGGKACVLTVVCFQWPASAMPGQRRIARPDLYRSERKGTSPRARRIAFQPRPDFLHRGSQKRPRGTESSFRRLEAYGQAGHSEFHAKRLVSRARDYRQSKNIPVRLDRAVIRGDWGHQAPDQQGFGGVLSRLVRERAAVKLDDPVKRAAVLGYHDKAEKHLAGSRGEGQCGVIHILFRD